MTIFPNGKINIGLWVTSKRDDGFHNIESVFYPVGVKDACEFVLQDPGYDSDEFTQTGYNANCTTNENLAIKAVELVRSRYKIPALKIHLHKAIPPGAGLGGGSSDAAYMLRYLNRYFRLGNCNNTLRNFAAELGSDCPFFIENYPAHASGRGEILKRIKPVEESYKIIIINPGIHINTAEAYSWIVPKPRNISLPDLFTSSIENWKDTIENDFESEVFARHPQIAEIKKELYKRNAIYSSMTGSGSSVYGIFRDNPPKDLYPDYWQWSGNLFSK